MIISRLPEAAIAIFISHTAENQIQLIILLIAANHQEVQLTIIRAVNQVQPIIHLTAAEQTRIIRKKAVLRRAAPA